MKCRFKVALPYSNFEMFLLAEKSVPQQMQDLPQVWKEQHHQMKETYHSKEFKTTKTKPFSKEVQKIKKNKEKIDSNIRYKN